MKAKLARVILAVMILFIVSPASIALADQSDPDSTPTVEKYAFRNILETGDMGILIYANIPYASTPTATVAEAFIWRLIDTDGTTELGQSVGYPWNDNGYGYNAYWLYFSAADAPTWGSAYTLRLSGNPAVFVTPPEYNYPIISGDYSTLTDQTSVRTAIGSRILLIATDMDLRWGLGTALSLLLETETGTVLSIYGESVFRGVITGCQSVAPSIFRFNVSKITATDRAFSSNFTDNISSQYVGTWVETAQTGGGDFFGASYDLMTILLLAAVCIGLIWLNTRISNNVWSALMDTAIVLIVAARLGLGFGDAGIGWVAMVTALFWTYDSMKISGLVGR